MIKFLLGVEPDPDTANDDIVAKQRRWSPSQTREFNEVHSAIAYLILSCDMTPYRSCSKLTFSLI